MVPITAAIALAATTSANAATYQVVYTFLGGTPTFLDGSTPAAGLVADAQGRLYGTTSQGGSNGGGTVFRLTAPANGQGPWTEEILHGFSGLDGGQPEAPVLLGSDGSIYGTTNIGGPNFGVGNSYGQGVVFKLANTPGWPLTLLHSFTRTGGGFPTAGLSFGPNGALWLHALLRFRGQRRLCRKECRNRIQPFALG